jgi:hypothetical protein
MQDNYLDYVKKSIFIETTLKTIVKGMFDVNTSKYNIKIFSHDNNSNEEPIIVSIQLEKIQKDFRDRIMELLETKIIELKHEIDNIKLKHEIDNIKFNQRHLYVLYH